MKPRNDCILITSAHCPQIVDVTKASRIPNEQTLNQWKRSLQKINISNGYHYYQTAIGNFDIKAIDEMMQIHKMIKTSSEVSKELTWFGLIKTIPENTKETARITALNCFK